MKSRKQQAAIGKERYGLLPQKNAFLIRDEDVLHLSAKTEGIGIENQLDDDLVKALIVQLDSAQSFAQIKAALADRWDVMAIKAACEQLLDVCIEVPHTLEALENQMPLNGLLRFPVHSPYKVPRAYWENSISLRRALPLLYEATNNKEKFLVAIAGLHRVATVGETGDNVYGGSGGIPTEPGSYRRETVVTSIKPWHIKTLEWWLRCLNVPVKLVKEGEIKSLAKRPMVEIKKDGLYCVHVCDNDGASVVKLLDEARENLNNSIRFADKGNVDLMLGYLARFTQLFAIAHPFHNINASIAMNIVNAILESQKLGRLPHLYFDYMAQRTRPSDFSLFFKAAVEKHRITSKDQQGNYENNREDNQEGLTNMRRLFEAASVFLEEERVAFEMQKIKRQ